MANGDAAAALGFTPIAATDDFRLGYDGINRAADFAATRVRYFTASSDSTMNGLTGMKRGDLCFRSDNAAEYKYTGSAWRFRMGAGAVGYVGSVQAIDSSFDNRVMRTDDMVTLSYGLSLSGGGNFSKPSIDSLLTIPDGWRPAKRVVTVGLVYSGGWAGTHGVELFPDGVLHLDWLSPNGSLISGSLAYAVG